MIDRLLARHATTVSSSVAIGTATLFVAVAAFVSLAFDRPQMFAASWSLRGTIAPTDGAAPSADLGGRRREPRSI